MQKFKVTYQRIEFYQFTEEVEANNLDDAFREATQRVWYQVIDAEVESWGDYVDVHENVIGIAPLQKEESNA